MEDEFLFFAGEFFDFPESSFERRNGSGFFLVWIIFVHANQIRGWNFEDFGARLNDLQYNDYGQATNIRIGGGSANPLNEEYTFDANTGLMTNQKVKRSTTTLMDLTYSYARGSSKGSINGTTGNLTKIVISTETKTVFMNSTRLAD